jgi:acetyl-CoA C-acetyltransferase
MRKVVIVSGVRTAVGAFGGGLKDVSAVTMGHWSCAAPYKRPV